MAAEGEDLSHQVCGPFSGFIDLIEIVPQSVVHFGVCKSHVGVAHDGAEDIVKIMGNSTSKCSDGLHLLGLEKLGHEFGLLLLSPFARGYVAGNSKNVQHANQFHN